MTVNIADALKQLLEAAPIIEMDQREIFTRVDLGQRPGTESTVRLRLVSSFSDRKLTASLEWEVVTQTGGISYSWRYPKRVVLAQEAQNRFSQKQLAYGFHAATVVLGRMLDESQPSEPGQPLMVPEAVADLFDLGYDELRKREESAAANVG